MCQFFSAVVKPDGIIFDKNIDQHETLIESANLDDTSMNPDFVRVELTPIDGDVFNHDPNNWKFIIDQDLIPEWFDEKVAEKRTREALGKVLKEVCFINCKDLVVKNNDRVFVKNSTVTAYGNSIVYAYGYSTVTAYDESTVSAYGDSYICKLSRNVKIKEITYNAIIRDDNNLYKSRSS